MSYLIDTNIIAEVRKGSRCDAHVARWWAGVADTDLFLSVLVLGEIRKGIERARPRDPAKAITLERWLDTVSHAFAQRILSPDPLHLDQAFLSGIIPGTGIPPMLRLVDIAAFDRVLVDIIQFLTHHYLGVDELRVTAFLPNLIPAFGLCANA